MGSYQPVIRRSYLTEINISTAPIVGQRINFLDVPELRAVNAIVYGIEVFDVNTLTKSPNNAVVVAALTGIVITIAEASTETLYQFPCRDLAPNVNSGLIRMFSGDGERGKQINLTKSYITILNTTGLNVGESVLVNFIYESVKGSRFREPSKK